MMRKTGSGRGALLTAALLVGALALPASATTLIEDFNNWEPGGVYGVWAHNPPNYLLASGADSYYVHADTGWGGGWYALDAPVDATGETAFQLDITFGATNETPVIVLGIEDADGTFQNFAWYGLPTSGSQSLMTAASSNIWESVAGTTPGLDMGNIFAFHIQADGGGGTTTDVYFENLNAVPEPASLTLLALGGWALLRRR